MRRRNIKRHRACGERLQSAPYALKVLFAHAGARSPGVREPSLGIVVGEQDGAEVRAVPSGSVQPTTMNSSRFRHFVLSHRPQLPGA